VVFTVHWRCNGVDGEYAGTAYGTQSVTYEAGAPFTPYADLTQDQVLGWIWAGGVDKDATELAVDKQIQELIAPTVQTPPLPWNS